MFKKFWSLTLSALILFNSTAFADSQNGSSQGSSRSLAAADRNGRSGSEWGVDSQGQKVYFTGNTDNQGRPGIFRYDNQAKLAVYGYLDQGKPVFTAPRDASSTILQMVQESKRRVYYPKAAYPEAAGSKTPIPRNQSLVVIDDSTGKLKDLSSGRTGQAELSNRFTDRYLKSEPVDQRFRPSNLQRMRELRGQTADWVKGEVKKLTRGERNGLVQDSAELSDKEKSKPQRNMKPMLEMGKAMGAFYIVMGMMAGVMLYTEYSANPAAWSAYIESSTDPIGLIQLPIFLAVAGGTYYAGQKLTRKMFGEPALSRASVRTGLYAGSMLAAVFASTVAAEMMADPDFAKCNGFAAYKETGKFTRDVEACDRFFDTWTSNKRWNKLASEQLMPMFANIMVAGGLLKAAELGVRFIMSRQFVMTTISRIGIGFAPRGGPLVAFGGLAIRFALFLGAYQISDQVFGVGQWTREFFAADWNFSNDPLGNGLFKVQSNLMNEWRRLKSSDYQAYVIPQNSITPTNLEFTALVNKYAEEMQNWRQIQMAETENAVQQWRLKSDAYYAMLEVSGDFYRNAVARMAYQARGEAKDGNGYVFNADFAKDYAAAQKENPTPSWKFLNSKNFMEHWKYVNTYRLEDYLVASMACGPEAEGYVNEQNWVVGKVSSLWSNWVTGNTTPKQVIDDSAGWSIALHPPRIVRPLDGYQSSICQNNPHFNFLMPAGPGDKVEHFRTSVDGKEFMGLYDYIRDQVRPTVLEADGKNDFDAWWARTMGQRTEIVEKNLRREFEELLNTVYRTTLTKHEYKSCAPAAIQIPSLEAALRQYTRNDDTCPMDAGYRLGRGIMDNIRDEMRLYMGLLTDLYASNKEKIGPAEYATHAKAESAVVANSTEMLDRLEVILKGANEIDPSRRPDIEAVAAEFNELSKQQKLYLLTPAVEEPGFLKEMKQTNESLQATMRSKMDLLAKVYNEGKGEGSPELAKLRSDFQELGKNFDERRKQIENFERSLNPNSRFEEWAYMLGTRIDASFAQALALYKILMTFEKEKAQQ